MNIVNLRILRRAVEEHGGRIVGIEPGSRHFKITIAMANGHGLVLRLSRSRLDAHKLRGWVRQRITNFTIERRDAHGVTAVTVDGNGDSGKGAA